MEEMEDKLVGTAMVWDKIVLIAEV